MPRRFETSSDNTFRVNWDGDGTYPTSAGGCASAGCETVGATCLCNVTTASAAVFTDPDSVPSSDSVLGALHVGAFDPSRFDRGTYARCATAACNASDVVVWLKQSSGDDDGTAGGDDDAAAGSVALGACYLASLATSCDDTCEGLGGTCSTATLEAKNYLFNATNAEDAFAALGVTCGSVEDASTANAAPYYNSNNGQCYPSASTGDGKSYRCQASGSSNQQRVCCCDDAPSAVPIPAPTPAPSTAAPIATDDGSVAAFDADTVFEVLVTSDTVFGPSLAPVGASAFFANVASTVYVGNGSYAFRNPPTFMALFEATARDAAAETDAVLDHYVTHPNVPPFVAKRRAERYARHIPSSRLPHSA